MEHATWREELRRHVEGVDDPVPDSGVIERMKQLGIAIDRTTYGDLSHAARGRLLGLVDAMLDHVALATNDPVVKQRCAGWRLLAYPDSPVQSAMDAFSVAEILRRQLLEVPAAPATRRGRGRPAGPFGS